MTTSEFTMRVSQRRSKLVVVHAKGPYEAQQKALEQVEAEYGGWDWERPLASYVSGWLAADNGHAEMPPKSPYNGSTRPPGEQS